MYRFCRMDTVHPHQLQSKLRYVYPKSMGLALPGRSVDIDGIEDGYVPVLTSVSDCKDTSQHT